MDFSVGWYGEKLGSVKNRKIMKIKAETSGWPVIPAEGISIHAHFWRGFSCIRVQNQNRFCDDDPKVGVQQFLVSLWIFLPHSTWTLVLWDNNFGGYFPLLASIWEFTSNMALKAHSNFDHLWAPVLLVGQYFLQRFTELRSYFPPCLADRNVLQVEHKWKGQQIRAKRHFKLFVLCNVFLSCVISSHSSVIRVYSREI